MKNKPLILLMSCNQELYGQEEEACRETFLKDAERLGIPYYFYKGTEEGESIDTTTHTMYFNVNDGLAGTSKKTLMALQTALSLEEDWDYIIKTNVSTYLNMENITKALDKWAGREDENIYGARFIANKYSLHVPFPRGHFMILSRSMVEGLMDYALKLSQSRNMPRTDDTLIGLSLLYYIQKILGKNYIEKTLEIPAVNEWKGDDTIDMPDFNEALCIRCKDETDKERTPDNIRLMHDTIQSGTVWDKRRYRRRYSLVETPYGITPYELYNKIIVAQEKYGKKEDEE